MQHIKIITLAFCLICSCQTNAQKQDESLYGNIYLTDNIETCLAKGTVQSTRKSIVNPTGFTLANNSFIGIPFEKSAVKFNNNNNIEYVKLSTKHGYKESNVSDNTESIFNQALQNLCRQYSNMQMYTIDKTIEGDGYIRRMQGQGYKWETTNKIIKLEHYTGSIYNTENLNMNAGLSITLAIYKEEYCGNFVELTFEKK